MKTIPLIISVCLLFQLNLIGQKETIANQFVVTTDIDNYWKAYDQIVQTKNKKEQLEILKKEYLNKGTEGLEKIIWARRYQPEEFVDNINSYPKFWSSIRANIGKTKTLSKDIAVGIQKLKDIYPALKPAKIYFTVGAFRTGGTTVEDKVLIGSEIAMADPQTDASELTGNHSHLPDYFKQNPLKNIVFTNVHEYIHTQQVDAMGSNLLIQCLREGIAEYFAEIALDQKSTTPAISYGKKNDEALKKEFPNYMFSNNYGFWLWSNDDNKFNKRDLGYYMGYAIANKYYNDSRNKKWAAQQLIELDYSDIKKVEAFVDETGYFPQSVASYRSQLKTPELLAQEQLDAYNKRDIEAFLKPYADGVEVYGFPDNLYYKGKDKMREQYKGMFERTPDLHCELKNRIVEGDTVIDHEEVSGFKKGESFNAIAIYKIEGNKIAKVYFIQ